MTGPMRLGSAVAWLFIVVVAVFLTQPTAEQHSVFEEPLALPAELEPLLLAEAGGHHLRLRLHQLPLSSAATGLRRQAP